MRKKLLLLLMAFLLIYINVSSWETYSLEYQEIPAAPINLIRRALRTDIEGQNQEFESNQFIQNEEFIIEYSIIPQHIPLEDVVGKNYNKNKEIVLVMDISGSMNDPIEFNLFNEEAVSQNEEINYDSIFDSNYAVNNIDIHLRNGRVGNDIHDYYVTFNKPNHSEDHQTRYLLFYSKDNIDVIEEYIKDLNSKELKELDKQKKANWINPRFGLSNKYWFRKNQKDIYGNIFREGEYYVYIATINYYKNNNELGHVVGLMKADKLIENKSNYQRKIDVMKMVTKNFLEKLEDNGKIKVALVPYESYAKTMTYNNEDFAALADDNTYRLYGRDFTQYEDLLYDIENLYAEGGTNIGDGLRKAYYKLYYSEDSSSDKYIILMTDGEPTQYSYVYDETPISNIRVIGEFWWNRYYYLGAGYNYFIGGNGRTGTEKDQRYAEVVCQELVSKSPFNINTFVIGFSNGVNEEKLGRITNAANGYYKEAENGNALDIVYNQLAEQIESDLPIHSIYFEEKFPDDIEIIEIIDVDNRGISLMAEGQKVFGELGAISYILNEETGQFEAEPINFSIRVKGTKIGEYALGNDKESSEENYSYIKYVDLNGEETVKDFPELNISILEAEPPDVAAVLSQNPTDREKFNLVITVNEPCIIQVNNENGLLNEIDSTEEIGEDEIREYQIELTDDNLIGESLILKIIDLNGNEFTETISLLSLENILVEDYIHSDNLRPVTLIFKGETNLIFNSIKINSQLIENNIINEIDTYSQDAILIDGNNDIEVEIENQYNNKTVLSFEYGLDALSPAINVTFTDNNRKLLTEFNEEVNDLWVEIVTEGEEPEVINIREYINESKLSAIIDYNSDWNNKDILIYARDLSGNIGTSDLPNAPETQILAYGFYLNSTNITVSEENLNVVNGYEVELGVKLKTDITNPSLILHLNKDRNESINKIDDSTFTLYKIGQQGEIIDSHNITEDNIEVLYKDNIEKQYMILLPIEDVESEYILVFSFKAETTNYDELIINEIEIGDVSAEIRLNIVALPLIE